MLRKLMKYDLKYYRKIMLPLWAVLIIYGIVHGINTVFNYETFYDHIPIKAQAIVVVTGIYFIFCVNIILVIQRFWKSMYGKESYLTHTLPVTERKLILSKVFSAIIISFTTVFYLLCRKLYIDLYTKYCISRRSFTSRNTDSTFSGFYKNKSCFNHSLYDHIWNHMDDASDLSGIYSNMHWTDEK